MKVALLGPYPAHSRLAGGVDAVVLALVEGLAARPDIELHVVTAVPGLRAAEVERQLRLTLHRIPHPRGDRLLWHQPAVWPIRRALREIAPDVTHAHMAGIYADAALQHGGPAVITLHGVVFREAALALAGGPPAARARWLLDAWYERWIVRRARDLIAISPYVAEEYRRLTRARFHHIENPVAEQFFATPVRDVTGASADCRLPTVCPAVSGIADCSLGAGEEPAPSHLLLCVARLIPRKDILTLLHVFARVCAVIPGVRLEVAGQTDADPAYAAACRETVRCLGLEGSVSFPGSLPGNALAACYARADLVLLTSHQETAPVAIAEAMAAGRAVVATRVGGVPFMVADGRTGLLVEPGDVRGLADAAITLLKDPERRLAYGRAARFEAERRFRLEAVVERTIGLYNSL